MAAGDPSVIAHTDPVVIPPKRSQRRTPVNHLDTRNSGRDTRRDMRRSSSANTLPRNVPTSVATLLEVTAIPPRRSWTVRSSRKLPPGNHVEDFSRLLMEGIKPRDERGASLDGSGNSPLDFLLSPLDDEKSMLASELESDLSVRSTSPDSVPSLDHELSSDTSSSPRTPPSQRRHLDKRKYLSSPPEDCASDHPLLENEEPDSFQSFFTPSEPASVSSKPSSPSRTFPRLGSTFKSNLTASLRAIKSAAQTVSNFATPSVQPDDFLTRSLFSITPELTDDRRPLPMSEPPSPALRRYLNPITLSPAEMHVYHESPQGSDQFAHSCPVSIQMQTYNRSGSSTGRRRSRFSTGNASGYEQQLCSFDPEIPMTRQREPRENSDFLRVVVLEMNMRRSGKLRDDIPSRAKVWLPPRKPARLVSSAYGDEEETAIPQRWVGVSIECA
ncbi:hypothetical protein VTN96DRAFT_9319 [Rasamsonia emersonii]|uniref:Uncharacterized protein n=1 Tax=Rasamsonia emersonii (strain ATCC 16479 / CBS 393.64 / IMI 116815) TaxID=1408163 RepID=A0A0F4Z1S3_RASE3|nr:hypothetical protein T310_1687 [Rasamsonia emersonii CBS 393.64]KKA24300.1 hypothetical protein T310_1687 [Rasamsonia emersonii CBS 393.64]